MHDWTAIGAIATACSAIVSFILAMTSFAGIRLASRGLRVAEKSSFLDRRSYLDNLFLNLHIATADYKDAGLPLWSQEYEATSPEYLSFHKSHSKLLSSLRMIELSGLPDLLPDIANSRPSRMHDLIKLTEWSMWAYYFSLTYSHGWSGSHTETWERLLEFNNGIDINEALLDEIKTTFDRMLRSNSGGDSEDIAETEAELTCQDCSIHLLEIFIDLFSEEYKKLAQLVAPWNSIEF